MTRLHLAAASLVLLPATLHAQALLDRSVRTGPQVVSYRVDAADERTITQFAFPIAVAVPLWNRLSVDIATAYASVTYDSASFRGKIDGLTDTQLRASYTLGTDNVVFTMGLNLPTGQETVNLAREGAAAGQIGNDFLAFPVSNMGTGFAGTGGVFSRVKNARYLQWEDAFEVEFDDGLSFLEPHATIRTSNRIAPGAKPVRVEVEAEFRHGFIITYDNEQKAEVSWSFIRELPPKSAERKRQKIRN
jgi:hypothetical protein